VLEVPIHEIILAVMLIIQIKAGAIVGSASGFFYTRGEDLFLVTNQHVCANPKDKVFADTLRLRRGTSRASTAHEERSMITRSVIGAFRR
jgi:S1-C subfamily serine protease